MRAPASPVATNSTGIPWDMNISEFAEYIGVPKETARRIVVVQRKVPHERPSERVIIIRGADAKAYKDKSRVEVQQ